MYFLKKFVHSTIINLKNEKSKCFLISQVKNVSTSTETKEKNQNKQKSLRVAVIGVPNAGKSTFINNLINHRVCPTSSKVHTTRRANTAICTINDSQLVLFDTPGLVTPNEIKKYHLESSFKKSYKHSIQHADAIAVVHDVSNSWTRNELHSTVLDTLNAYPKLPSLLVLNKIDVLKSKRILLDLVRLLTNNTLSTKLLKYRKSRNSQAEPAKGTPDENKTDKIVGWSNFSEIFMVSSITGDGLTGVMNFLVNQAKPSPWQYPLDAYTDESPETLVVESVRARMLDYLPQEIPYTLKSQLEYFSEEKNTIYTSVQVICPNARIERLICGEANGKLIQITERVTSDLVETFGKPISLSISTIVSKKSAEISS